MDSFHIGYVYICKIFQGYVSIEEWQVLYNNAVLVLEENDLVHEKLDLMSRKAEAIEKSHQEKGILH